jgi:segregation and condensation protein B
VSQDREALLEYVRGEVRRLMDLAAASAGATLPEHGYGWQVVAEGLTVRTHAAFADYVRALREERPVRLSQASLETLAIVAYRQPVTKPEMDHIRGVDCGATLRLLLDRGLVRMVGKRDEPGRPILYGTTREFLSFFNLPNLAQLPSLREFHELSADSQEELATFEQQQPTLVALSEQAKALHLGDEPAVAELDQAMTGLAATESTTRDALLQQGVVLVEEGVSESSAGATSPNEESRTT